MIRRRGLVLLLLVAFFNGCGDDHGDDQHGTHPKLTWEEVALGCAIMGEGEAAHTMCNHGHSLSFRSESLYARWLFLRHHGVEPASEADLMMSGEHGHGSEHVLPEPLTPVLRANLGEKVRLRVISYGPNFHTFHVHGHLWMDADRLIDNRTLGPAEVHHAEFFAGANHDDPATRSGLGDWMYHCHVDTHSASGMWSIFRVLDPANTSETPNENGKFPWEVPTPVGGPGETVDIHVVAVETPLTVTREFLPATGELVAIQRPMRLYVPVADAETLASVTAAEIRNNLRERRETFEPWVISVKVGTRLRVHLRNLMPEAPVSLHPHGVITTPAHDGTMPESVALARGPTVIYDWVADTPGTWPLHDHARTIENLGRGLFSALIVHPDGPTDVDRDYLVLMHDFDMDWFMGNPEPSGGGH